MAALIRLLISLQATYVLVYDTVNTSFTVSRRKSTIMSVFWCEAIWDIGITVARNRFSIGRSSLLRRQPSALSLLKFKTNSEEHVSN